MNMRWRSVLLVFLFFCHMSADGMSAVPAIQPAARSPIAMSFLYAKVVARTTDGQFHYGLLAGVENDCLLLKKGTNEERIPGRDISELTIEAEKRIGSTMAAGMALGVYLGNVVFFRAKGQPTAFAEDNFHSNLGYLLWDSVFAAAGGGLGYLVSLLEKGERVFRFSGSETDRLAEWERLKGVLSGRPRSTKIRLSIQAGLTLTSTSHRYRDAFAKAGYDTTPGFEIPSPGEYRYVYGAGSFNLLRRVQLTVSLRPRLEVGAAAVFSGEPGMGGYQYSYSADPAFWRTVWQTYKATGYYAVAAYEPLLGRLPGAVRWEVGLGAGASRVGFELGMHSEEYDTEYEEKWDGHRIAETVPSGMAFTELAYSMNPHLSLGLTAEYIFGPSKKIPEFPEWNIPGQKIRLGNGFIGLALGVHY